MLTYIIHRLLLMIPTLIGVTAVVFFVMAWAPGGFGGQELNQQGAQTEGEEARRIRLYFEARYGLGKPAYIQYGRWLNQISPVGFALSDQVTFTDADRDAMKIALSHADEVIDSDNQREQAEQVIVAMAQFQGTTLEQATEDLLSVMRDPQRARGLMDRLGIAPGELFWQKFERALGQGEDRAAAVILEELTWQAPGLRRVVFSMPMVKWPDLGQSLRGRRVADLLLQTIPITLLLNALSLPLIYGIAIISGIYAARHRGGWFDVGSGTTFLGLWSLPQIWVGVMLIGLVANREVIKLFPTAGLNSLDAAGMTFLPALLKEGFSQGWLLDRLWHLILPVLCMTYAGFAFLSKLTRGSILENLYADFTRTARAKGVRETDVLFRHVLRNSLLPLITVFINVLPAMFVGSVVVETIFSIQGMGKLGVEAAFMKDRELVMATTFIGALIGLGCAIARDILYAMADPRVSYE